MTRGGMRFSPNELPIDGSRVVASDIAVSMAVARDLQTIALGAVPAPSAGFVARVMTAVAAEPVPQPVAAFARALAGGRVTSMLAAVRDAWRVSTSPGRPTPVRAQALALVVLVLLAFGSLASIAGAAVGLLDSRPPSSSPMPTRPVIVAPAPSAGPADQTAPAPTASPKPTATSGPTTRPTLRPTAAPRRTATPQPTESDEPGGGGDDGRDADDSPSPSPSPTETSSPGGTSGPG